MMHEHFRAALEQGDVALLRKVWAHVHPHLPQPKTDAEAEAIMHASRTQARTISFSKRAYSHAWLLERNLPSGLPDELRPRAQRMYPVVAASVGLAVASRYPEVVRAIGSAQVDVVENAYADNKPYKREAAYLKPRIADAGRRAVKKLFGR